MERLQAAGDFSPPRLATLERAVEQALACAPWSDGARASARFNVHHDGTPELPGPLSVRELKRRERRAPLKAGRVFADTWNLEIFSNCSACFEKRRQRLHTMNLSQIIRPTINCQICRGT
jgi:hypothetical protein